MSTRVGIASLIWASTILLSRVVGLVREAVLGRTLGAGAEADVYHAAFIIPDWLNYLLAGGALSIVFIPIFGAYLARDEEERGWEAFSVIANFLVVLMLVVMTGLWVAMPAIVDVVFPKFDASQRAELVALTRIVLPAQLFHVLGGLLSASLQARDRHALPAIAPLLYTGSIVAGGLIGGQEAGAYGFAWGVLVGSVLGPFGLPLLGCLRSGLRWMPRLSLRHEDLRTYLWRSLPIMLAFSVVAVDEWIFKVLAQGMDEGSVAITQYARNLMKVPIGVFGLAIGAATFPTLTRLVANDDRAAAHATLSQAVQRILILALGAQVVLTCAGPEISRVIYGGRITDLQHETLGLTLAVMCLGLWAWAIQSMLARGFYAMGKTWLPSLLGTGVVLGCLPLYIALGREAATVGLAAAGAVAITIYVVVLAILLRREFAGRSSGYGAFAARAIPALALGILTGHHVGQALDLAALLGLDGVLAALAQGALQGGVGGCVYLIVAVILRVPGLAELAKIAKRRRKT
ncbi:putative peptidoglycan biosynthesis protein MurJ [Enhygromyxa salina]|uniref:Putative peptidoglycan biosynthesis protein MurJ n=1 Tax=Enhygromyxa salina TaxID=215803 RepID=A0A2S9XEZ4_9BACT|nr:murein biosynthesis integral membrane protein MurJ [Enhygromyxa salina]PRP91435.1 putative peptidoglycan biosynthesis protein MurJ [Enhygromyxa salina]